MDEPVDIALRGRGVGLEWLEELIFDTGIVHQNCYNLTLHKADEDY
jgi:hypothetical protein